MEEREIRPEEVTARIVLSAFSEQLASDEVQPERIVIEKATPLTYIGRVYRDGGREYDGVYVSFLQEDQPV